MTRSWWSRRLARVAVVFTLVGLTAAVGAVLYPDSRRTLSVVAATFLFGGVLMAVSATDRRIRASVAERIYADLAANEASLVEAQGLSDTVVYVPHRTRDHTDGSASASGGAADEQPVAWLFVPSRSGDETLTETLTSEGVEPTTSGVRYGDPNGVWLRPTGNGLFGEFESMLANRMSDSPDDLGLQLADCLTEGLELADRAELDVDPEDERITFRVADSLYGPLDRFDHPVQSFLGVGLAIGLGRPVITTVTIDDGQYDYVVTCRWLRPNRSPSDNGEFTPATSEPNRRSTESRRERRSRAEGGRE